MNKINYNKHPIVIKIYYLIIMNYELIGFISLGMFSFLFINNYEKIKLYYLKEKSNYEAKKITKDFFKKLIKTNPNTTLEIAILKFENADKDYDSLESFSKDKGRKKKII